MMGKSSQISFNFFLNKRQNHLEKFPFSWGVWVQKRVRLLGWGGAHDREVTRGWTQPALWTFSHRATPTRQEDHLPRSQILGPALGPALNECKDCEALNCSPTWSKRRGAQLLKMCPSIFSFQAEGAKLMTDQGNWLVQINPAISGFVLQCQNTSSPGCPPSSIAHLSMVPSDFTVNPFMAYGDGFLLAPMAIFK